MAEQALQTEYDQKQQTYQRLAEEAEFILREELAKKKIKYGSLIHRVKTWESFSDKVQRKQCEKPFQEINDVVGIRVVCLFLSDIRQVQGIIQKSFRVIASDNKIDGHDLSSFGYMSHHFVVELHNRCRGARYDDLKGLRFEVQVRTIAMDAWANISHYLDYKSEEDIPSGLKRDFHAISGLFYVADKHFEMFFQARDKAREHVAKMFENDTVPASQEINLDSLLAYLVKRLPDREHSDSDVVSEVVGELSAAGYRHIGEIDHAFEVGWDAFAACERDTPPIPGPRFADVGVIRVLFSILDDNFRKDGRGQHSYEAYKRLLKQ